MDTIENQKKKSILNSPHTVLKNESPLIRPITKPKTIRTNTFKLFIENINEQTTRTAHDLAAGLGLEPRYSPSEGDVLPLDDPAYTKVLTEKTNVYNYLIVSPRFLEAEIKAVNKGCGLKGRARNSG